MVRKVFSKAEELSDILHDYQHVEMSKDHVITWVEQFPNDSQYPILDELTNVFGRTYVSKNALRGFLTKLVFNKALTSDNPEKFWSNATMLRVQTDGHSQIEMTKELSDIVNDKFGFPLSVNDNNSKYFLYLDDFIFSGNRLKRDLSNWFKADAPKSGELHYVFIGWHAFGQYSAFKEVKEASILNKKDFSFKGWKVPFFSIENRKYKRNESEVLWPTQWPKDPHVDSYIKSLGENTTFFFREEMSLFKSRLFSCSENRRVLEDQLLIAGAKIRSFCNEPKKILRPLGFSSFPGPGFGSLVVTYRNCPNNCPLAFWWGDVKAPSYSPFSKWYPLLPRQTYSPS